MSGHSKWNNIKRKKEKTDGARAKVFTKIGREIAVAVKEGGGNPASNSKLAALIAKAKANSVPNDNIQRIIKRAEGGDKTEYEAITYEGYGPGGIAVMVETLTDNRNRTAANMRRAAAKGFINATDCADYLTKKGMPFRDAYKLTGCMVSDCISKDKTLEELTLDEFKGYSALFENDIYDAIDLIKCCEGRTSYGGPSEASVKKQIELASAQLGAWEAANA